VVDLHPVGQQETILFIPILWVKVSYGHSLKSTMYFIFYCSELQTTKCSQFLLRRSDTSTCLLFNWDQDEADLLPNCLNKTASFVEE